MKTLAAFVLPIALIAVVASPPDDVRARGALDFGVPYEVVAGLAVYEGDLILGAADEVALWSAERWRAAGARLSAGAVPSGYRPDGTFCTWPDGIIPYVIDDDVPRRDIILRVIETVNRQTVLRFVERMPQHDDYVRFTLAARGGSLFAEPV